MRVVMLLLAVLFVVGCAQKVKEEAPKAPDTTGVVDSTVDTTAAAVVEETLKK